MGHLNKTFFSYMTTQDAWDEYLELIKDGSLNIEDYITEDRV